MKEQITKAKEWWHNLAAREKMAVSVGGTALVLFIFYAGFYSPLLNSVNTMRSNMVTQENVLTWMKSADLEINKAGSTPGMIKSKSKTTPIMLLSLLQKQITQVGLAQALTEIKQSGNAGVQVAFKKVDFDKFISLLIKTLNEQQVSVSQLTVTASNAPGVVDVALTLKIPS